MPRTLLLTALLLPFSATLAHAQVPGTLSRNAGDERARYHAEAMRDAMVMLGDWQNAWTRDDVRSLGRFYDPDALLRLPDQASEVQGRQKVTDLLRTRLPQLGRVELLPVDAAVGDQLLYLYQRYVIAPPNESPDLTTPPLFTGTCVTVLEREVDGGWRIRAQLFDPPASPAAEAAAH